uniref:TLC domain-containing protein n=1 Tax=Eptatretus burgeri TaxID=7764 RepID=A0A8C4N4Z3_EPTBU
MGLKKKSKNPPVFSHEYLIQNHADVFSSLALLIAVGLMFRVSSSPAALEKIVGYGLGPKDSATVVFYSLLVVVVHAILQEYGFDVSRARPHDSRRCWGHNVPLARFYISVPFPVKLYFICQLAYWLHAVPELYLQRMRKVCPDLNPPAQAKLAILTRLGVVLLCLHYVPELLFHSARLLYYLSALVLQQEPHSPCVVRRVPVLGIVCFTQAWLLWHFLRLQISRWREAQRATTPVSTNATRAKQRPARKDGGEGLFLTVG